MTHLGWAGVLFKALAEHEKSAQRVGGMGPIGNELEKRMDELIDSFQKWIMAKKMEPRVREFIAGTYVDASGLLIRRGT